MIGIYSVTSPSGKVYIGQSWDVKKRHRYYTNWKNCVEQVGLSRSIKKYGYNNHKCDILIELPPDVTQEVLDQHEIFFINQFRSNGISLLNMKEGGLGGRISEESIEKLKAHRAKQIPPTLGKKHSEESKRRISEALKGRKASPEAVEKSRLANIGRKASEQTRANLRAARAKNNIWIGRKHTDESRLKQRLAKIGNKINIKKVRCIETGQVFPSVIDAAIHINVKPTTLSARIRNGVRITPQFTYDV